MVIAEKNATQGSGDSETFTKKYKDKNTVKSLSESLYSSILTGKERPAQERKWTSMATKGPKNSKFRETGGSEKEWGAGY